VAAVFADTLATTSTLARSRAECRQIGAESLRDFARRSRKTRLVDSLELNNT